MVKWSVKFLGPQAEITDEDGSKRIVPKKEGLKFARSKTDIEPPWGRR